MGAGCWPTGHRTSSVGSSRATRSRTSSCTSRARPSRPRKRKRRQWRHEHRDPAGNPRRIFGAHAAHCLPCLRHGDPKGVRSSLTHPRMRSLRCSAILWGPRGAAAGGRPWPPNLSPRVPSVSLGVQHAELNALFGFAERQLHVVRRYWVWEIVWLFYSLVSVLSIGFLASGLGALGVGSGSFDLRRAQLYLLIGALLWGYLSLVFMEAAYAISWERWEGTIEYTFMAPVRRMTHLMGICLFAIVYGLARTFIVLIVAVAIFDLDFSHADIGGAVVVLAASMAPLIGLAILTSVLPLLSPQKGEQMSFAVQGFLLLVSGVYYPLSVLPWPLQLAGFVSPLTYALAGMRTSLLQGATAADQLPTAAILLAMGGVLIPIGFAVFTWAERRAKRLGLLKRSG